MITSAGKHVDPLEHCRDAFVGSDSPLVYFDGNSLGRPLRRTVERLPQFVEAEWGGRLIRGWDEGWYDAPLRVGDRIGALCLGAAAGQTVVGDSTTVLLYKLIRAAADAQVAADPVRRDIVIDSDNFPTDRYVVEGIARERGLRVRWIEVDRASGVSVEQVTAAVGPTTGVVVLSQVAYRSGYLADVSAITETVHAAGGLVLWDLCHSAGAVAIELDAWGVDLAVGCTYKYLNGGPGSPAFAYVAERHQATLRQPITGWMGHADPFLMGPDWEPAPGMRSYLSGTPAIVGMLAMEDMLDLIAEVGMPAVRAKSVALTERAIAAHDEMLVPLGVELGTPRDPARRGGHITLRHPAMREVVARLWERDVIPDYRDPGGLRVGLSPLSTSFEEVEAGMASIAEEVGRGARSDVTA